MLNEKEILDKLYTLPASFNTYMAQKNYAAAMNVYEKALTLVVFLEVPENVKIDLFGNRPYREEGEERREGLFREAAVLMASERKREQEIANIDAIRERRAHMEPRVINGR